MLFPWSPGAWPHEDRADNTPSSEWVAWAKRQIQEPDSDPVLYLCRLMRLIGLFHTDRTSDRPGVRFDLLNAAMVSGLAVAGGDASGGLTHLVESALQMAEQRGLVLIERIDEWHPGMASGSGWTRYIRLTVAGRRLVESRDPEPPPVLEQLRKTPGEQIGDVAAATQRGGNQASDTLQEAVDASDPEVAGQPAAAEGSRAKRKGGRKPDPKIAQRNRRIVRAFRRGAKVNEVTEKFGISADLARKIRSQAGLTRDKALQHGQP